MSDINDNEDKKIDDQQVIKPVDKKEEVLSKLRCLGTIIRIYNRLYVHYQRIYNGLYFRDYHENKIKGIGNDNDYLYDFVIHIDTKQIKYASGFPVKNVINTYSEFLKSVKVIEESEADKEFLNCLITNNNYVPQITELDKTERETLHIKRLDTVLKSTFAQIAKCIYKYSPYTDGYILKFDEALTYNEITIYNSHPAHLHLPNSDGVTRNKREYIYYIMNKVLNNGDPCEIDYKSHLSYIILNKIKEHYPTLKVELINEDNIFLMSLDIKFQTDHSLL